jgi:hypothetical protein
MLRVASAVVAVVPHMKHSLTNEKQKTKLQELRSASYQSPMGTSFPL